MVIVSVSSSLLVVEIGEVIGGLSGGMTDGVIDGVTDGVKDGVTGGGELLLGTGSREEELNAGHDKVLEDWEDVVLRLRPPGSLPFGGDPFPFSPAGSLPRGGAA